MKRILTELEKQSPEVKKRAAFLVALGMTSIIGVIWASTLPARFSSTARQDNSSASLGAPLSDVLETPIPVQEQQEAPQNPRDALESRVEELIEQSKRNERRENGVATTSSRLETATSSASTTEVYRGSIIIETR